MYTGSDNVRMDVIELRLRLELTGGYLGDQICSEECSRYVRELVRLEFQVLVEAHDCCVLSLISVSWSGEIKRPGTHIERYFVDKVHQIAKEHDRDNMTIDFVAQSWYVATSWIVIFME